MINLRVIRAASASLLALLLLIPSSFAQKTATPESSSSNAELHQALLDLTNPWTVMCVAAHPDDEDGTTLTVLRRKYGVHTVSLFSTYGEGGQNAVGPELYEELGVIRARETIAASHIQGSEPYFLGLKDFGFSKSAEEAFTVWGREEALRRMVFKLRELRPDVIITNHDTSRGHGHHQATGQLIVEAFDAAADPARFPEQLNKVKPWQAQRLFVRVFGPGASDKATPEKIVSIDPNEFDPVRGSSFAEQALTALQQHATQGPWPKSMEELLKARGVQTGKLSPIRYQLIREAAKAPQLPSSSATLLDGLKPSPAVSTLLSLPLIEGQPLTEMANEPERVLDALLAARKRAIPANVPADDVNRVEDWKARFDKALALAAGVTVTVEADSVLIPGKPTNFTVSLANAGHQILTIRKLTLREWEGEFLLDAPDQLLPDTDTTDDVKLTTPSSATFTVPKSEHLYDGSMLGVPFQASAELELEGVRFQVKGMKAVDVVPAVEITSISPSPCVKTEESLGHCRNFELNLVNHLDTGFRGTTQITDEAGHVRAERRLVLGAHESRVEKVSAFNTVAAPEALPGLRKSANLKFIIRQNTPAALITERSVPVFYSNARLRPDLHIAYVPSFDQTLERSLASFGVEAKALTTDDVQNADLSTYDTIIIDNRGYEAHRELIAANSKLLEFVNSGGTLIVFYHKSNEWNPDPAKNRPQLAPYPIVLGDERVTDETAPVRFLQPRHPLLNFPNRITSADFKGWFQERGLYYAKEWDNHYAALFSMNDKGEKPLRGGLLVGRYGKGNYIYTSMVWYRQLRAGVPGAYRMFANLISYGKR